MWICYIFFWILSPFWNKAANARSLLGFSLFYIQLKQKYTPLSDANMPEYKPLYKYISYTIHIFKLSPRPSCYHVPTPPSAVYLYQYSLVLDQTILQKLLRALWLTERCVCMRVCGRSCDVTVVRSILVDFSVCFHSLT